MLAAPLLSAALTLAAAHPGLFFGAADQAALRQKAATTHAEIAGHITAVLNAHVNDPAPALTDYDDKRFFGNAAAVWAFGYQLTGNSAYAAKGTQVLKTYLSWSDWGFGEGATQPDLSTAHMLLGVACAYDWLYEALDATTRQAVATRLGTEAQRMATAMPGMWWVGDYTQNHDWINAGGLGLAALALQGEDSRAASWLALSQANAAQVAKALNGIADGSFHEGAPYQVYGLGMAMPFWIALARNGTDLTDLGILRGFGRFRMETAVPEAPRQLLLPYGDFTGWPTEATTQVLRYAAARFKDGEAEAAAQSWLSAGARTNFLPELWYDAFEFLAYDPSVTATSKANLPLQSWFADLQAGVLRSSWNAGDLQLGFKAGPYGGRNAFDRMKAGGLPGEHLVWGHDHNDDLSFWLFGAGTWLAPEAMGYDAGVNTGSTNPANQTSFHNALLVDGQGELGDVRSSDSEWNNPWFYQRDAGVLTQATGTAHYAAVGGRGAALFDPALKISRWDRLMVLARQRYALAHDDVQAAASHAYDWICHFPDGATVDTASGWVQGVAKQGQLLGVRVIAPASFTATTGAQSANLMNLFDPDGSTSYVRVRASSASSDTEFLTAMVPMAATAWAARPQVVALSPSDAGAGAVVQPGSALEERWIFGRAGAGSKAASDLVLTGSLAGMAGRNGTGAAVRAFLLGPGQLADQNGSRPLLASQSATAVEAELSGTTLVVTGDNVADFVAFAPGATAATLNGVAVSAKFESNIATWSGTVIPPPGGGSGGGSSAGTGGGAQTPPTIPAANAGLHGACGGCSSGSDAGGGTFLAALALLLWMAQRRRMAVVPARKPGRRAGR